MLGVKTTLKSNNIKFFYSIETRLIQELLRQLSAEFCLINRGLMLISHYSINQF